jgi:hypothetical protein
MMPLPTKLQQARIMIPVGNPITAVFQLNQLSLFCLYASRLRVNFLALGHAELDHVVTARDQEC